jgi:DNA-directed RNA polymerase specialized sigma24 family protein
LLLQVYACAFRILGERERFVLEMVEVRRVRYAELAQILAIRPEALKMVVFRARKRIFDRMQALFGGKPAADRVRARDAGRPALAATG